MGPVRRPEATSRDRARADQASEGTNLRRSDKHSRSTDRRAHRTHDQQPEGQDHDPFHHASTAGGPRHRRRCLSRRAAGRAGRRSAGGGLTLLVRMDRRQGVGVRGWRRPDERWVSRAALFAVQCSEQNTSGRPISQIESIEREIEALDDKGFAAFRAWFIEYEDARWDAKSRPTRLREAGFLASSKR